RNDGDWHLYGRVELRKARDENRPPRPMKTLKARALWDQIAYAAWGCADPGVQYDTIINDWHTCPAGGRINASNPCSEYMFLDDTACNLASLNFSTFFDPPSATFDVPGIQHATRLWTVVLEISVLMAQYPSKEIAQRSYDYRTLGLGYANLGSCLMMAGIPYDSKEAMAVCGALTSILTGESYAASAEMAQVLGAFPKYQENSQHMLRVMRNHRRAAYNTPANEYEQVGVPPVGIDGEFCPDYLLNPAREVWDRALDLGRKHGYRNAQTTVIAPTGTIGLLMDCDTTGIEPDFALVKFKKLAGGGYFKIVNQSVEPALKHLGYDDKQRRDILDFIVGTNRLEGSPFINRNTLKAKGLTDADLERVERSLPGVLDVSWAFTPYTLGEDTLVRLGFAKEQFSDSAFSLLKEFGFTQEQIDEATLVICGHQTIEGAPHVKTEHLPVFDCANKCGKEGKRFIQHMGHVRMMAAAQPFISGAISKTINMPNEATLDDIKEAYMKSWELGLKAVALYRDGSKLSQVLSSGTTTEEKKEEKAEAVAKSDAALTQIITPPTPRRRPMPKKRRGYTYEAKIGGQKVYVRTGEYENGELGEIFIDMNKEGATMRSIMNCFAIAVSKGLQYGVPLEEYVNTFTFTRFEPQGIVDGHPNVKFATSVIDFVFRVLGYEYSGRTDFLQVKPEEMLDHSPVETRETGQLDKEMLDTPAAKQATPAKPPLSKAALQSAAHQRDVLDEQLEDMMGDAPMCDVCGHVTVRNGACYKCLNCGNSMGCS
ncbi:MAG: vitamin B12-dependent ribonucleotide reductase, partial [Planctomycetes bacterium]|nr:vitamin B12-dependent ribonucleotide reductase [Planctomycetota bacterium]